MRQLFDTLKALGLPGENPMIWIIVADLGHQEPTFISTSQLTRSAPKRIERYARQMMRNRFLKSPQAVQEL
jgi:hypothetical protein